MDSALSGLMNLAAVIYVAAVFGMFLFGVNSYVLISIFNRHKLSKLAEDKTVREKYWREVDPALLPSVTVQLPIYNEKYVISRQLAAVANLDYPAEKLEVQVLDDSTDETVTVVEKCVQRYRTAGLNIHHIRRTNREGYKAGALKEGMKTASGELLAIFDADFVPNPNFLKDSIPFFSDPRIGLVQSRWGHINGDYNLLTRAQSIGIDGHFSVEQAGRTWGQFFMNFNGTAGIWRKSAIEDAGGWQADTLTEDLDLSYRAQFKGWKMKYLLDVVTPAEVPAEINAFKSQQFRWAKGSIQTAMKNVPELLRTDVGWLVKYQALIHMGHYLVHPLMVIVALLAVPMLKWFPIVFGPWSFVPLAFLLLISTSGPSALYVTSQRALYERPWKRLIILPVLVCLGTGIAINNTKAVIEALLGIKSGFVRTPKLAIETSDESVSSRSYASPLTWVCAAELFLGLYSIWGAVIYVSAQKYLIGPFLIMYALGFLSVAWMSLSHAWQTMGRLKLKAQFAD